MDNTKCCTQCGIEKPRAEFNKDKSKSNGLKSACRECYRERDRERARKRREVAPEANRECARKWSKENPEKARALCSKRRARKRNALDPTASQSAIVAIHAEAKMAEAFTGKQFAVDHIVPMARGGKHHEDNLRSLPSKLNSIKGAKLDSEVTDPEFKAWTEGTSTYEQVTWRTYHRGHQHAI